MEQDLVKNMTTAHPGVVPVLVRLGDDDRKC
jgi:hypothetical protein